MIYSIHLDWPFHLDSILRIKSSKEDKKTALEQIHSLKFTNSENISALLSLTHNLV